MPIFVARSLIFFICHPPDWRARGINYLTLYERPVLSTSASRNPTSPNYLPIRRSMKTETRSVAENPFISLHLVHWLIFWHFTSSSRHRRFSPPSLSSPSAALVPLSFSKWIQQSDILETTLTREFVHFLPRCHVLISILRSQMF